MTSVAATSGSGNSRDGGRRCRLPLINTMPAVLAALWAGAGATATNLTRAGRGGAAAGSWRCRHRHERGDEGTRRRRGWWRATPAVARGGPRRPQRPALATRRTGWSTTRRPGGRWLAAARRRPSGGRLPPRGQQAPGRPPLPRSPLAAALRRPAVARRSRRPTVTMMGRAAVPARGCRRRSTWTRCHLTRRRARLPRRPSWGATGGR